MSPLRIGLIGAGWISRTYAAALRQVPEGRAVAVWSRTRENAERFASELELELATDRLEELLPHVDVVCVNSPNALHAEHAIAAARAGRHVIVEKPLAVSLEQGRAILEACRAAGVGLAYAEELPFVPKFARAREILRSGALGEPLYVTQREAHSGPSSPWFFTREEAGGGVLMDMACHSIELVRWLLGKPPVERVSAELANSFHFERTRLEDHAVVHLQLAGDVRALCEASWALHGGMQSKLEIWGSEGYLEVDLLHSSGLRMYTGDRWSTPLADWVSENGYPQELSHFLRCFENGERPEETGEDGLAVLEVLYAAYASAREGRTVSLPFQPPGVERAVDLWLEGDS
jgi:myo-inositol 2-dehydrogenase/D-chiro-inositol 1-dehydrogenase